VGALHKFDIAVLNLPVPCEAAGTVIAQCEATRDCSMIVLTFRAIKAARTSDLDSSRKPATEI
jgi:hypothetical protein